MVLAFPVNYLSAATEHHKHAYMSGQEVTSSGLWTLDSAGNASRVTDAVREEFYPNIYCQMSFQIYRRKIKIKYFMYISIVLPKVGATIIDVDKYYRGSERQ